MNSQQAKEILATYRPGIDDQTDPQFADALQQARQDPGLAHRLEQQYALDSALREKLKEIPVPLGLGTRILANRPPAKVAAWWRRPAFAGAAAALVVAALSVGFWLSRPPPNTFDAYRRTMVKLVAHEYDMEFKTKDLKQIRKYLAQHQAISDYTLTASLEKISGEGCAIIKWRDRKVSLVCLEAGSGEENDLFLFVIDRHALPDAPDSADPQFSNVGQLATAAWTKDDKLYILAKRGDQESLRKYL